MTSEPTPAKLLTKSQLKRAARDNKVRTRNVLFNPFRLEWPAVSKSAAAAVFAAIDTHIQQFDIPSGLPQEEYSRLLAAGDRAAIAARRQEARAAAAPLLAARRAHLADCVLGFNAASRALEAGRLAALLVEADTPLLETRFLLPLAAGRRCAAVCLSRLRPALHRRLGLQTAVFGLLQQTAETDHPLRPLLETVRAAAGPLLSGTASPGVAVPAAGDGADREASDGEQMEDAETSASAADNKDESKQSISPPETEPDLPSSLPTAAAAAAASAAAEPPSPVPFEQLDFISLSVAPPAPRSSSSPRDVIRLDREGVSHRRRLQLKEARVMKLTLGDKALKKAAKAAKVAKKKAGPADSRQT